MGRAVPEVMELSVAHLIEPIVGKTGGDVGHQIHPHGHFCAVEGCLFDDALRTVGHIADDDMVCLVGSIAEEIAFEHGLRLAWQLLQQFCVSRHHSLQLRLEGDEGAAGVNHHVVFLYFGAGVEVENLGAGVLILDFLGPFFHFIGSLGAKIQYFMELRAIFSKKVVSRVHIIYNKRAAIRKESSPDIRYCLFRLLLCGSLSYLAVFLNGAAHGKISRRSSDEQRTQCTEDHTQDHGE